MKILRTEIARWSEAKFADKNSVLKIAKWIIQTLDKVEEHRNLNAIEFNL
jgi:hypothetical protein